MRRTSLQRYTLAWFLAVILGVNLAGAALLSVVAPEAMSSISPATLVTVEVVTIALGALMLMAFAKSLERRLLHPLEDVEHVTRAITEGAVSGRIELTAEAFADVQRVADAVNTMAEKASKDIADMKRLERVRSEFVANVSHELRTPIFSVQGYLETLLDGALDDDSVRRQFLEKAFNNALRLNTLLSDLIDISRIESGELRLSFRYFDIVELLRDIIPTLELKAEQRSVRVEINPMPPSPLMVYGDKERLTQVLTNLIDNAIKYNVAGGTVTVTATTEGRGVRVSVADTGIGIPSEHVGRIFERFYRVDKDRSRAVGGTGLGLAIVKHILEAHHAPIQVSSNVGKGTTISFLLKGE